MKKVYVKWGFTDDYGIAYEEDADYNWFETKEEAEEFVAKMREGNGGYFELWNLAEGDYEEFLRIKELEKELARLKKLF